ncbi:MAG TPA: citrate synthase [Euzebyales bacterium]|nr:citrate synthase [Euzebyales bacterium]
MTSPQTVADVMKTPALTATPDEQVQSAAERMNEHRTGSVVVLDGNRVVGILTERDVLRVAAAGADSSKERVADWMSTDPVTAAPSLPATDALKRLITEGFRHIPIVENGDVAGIVSMRDLMAIAKVERVQHPGELEAPKGLAGVTVAETDVGGVRGREGFFHYRQYAATDLARARTFDDVWHLLLLGTLPGSLDERAAFLERVKPLRSLSERTSELLKEIAVGGTGPLDGLRTGVSLVAAEEGFRPSLDTSADELRQQALRITAIVPTIIATLYRAGRGEEPVEPHPDLPYAANYLYMLTGDVHEPEQGRAIEQYLISTVDHGFNASTFTARVITSTGADLGAAITGAIGALSGPLHGGAPSRALDLLDEIGTVDRAEAVVRRKIENGERIMGFGHRVYKTRDPRSVLLREVAERVGGAEAELAVAVEDIVVDTLAELKPGRELYANVEYYAGIVMEASGLPPELFTATFAASRTVGWCAHVLEQAADNRIIRPSARYVGPPPPQDIPTID